MGRAGAPARRRCRPSDVLPVFRSSRTERVGGARTGCRGASLKRRMRLAEGNCGAESSGGRPLGDGLNPERRPHEACHRGEPTAPEKTSGAFRSTPPRGGRRASPDPERLSRSPRHRLEAFSGGGRRRRWRMDARRTPFPHRPLDPGSLTAFGRANEKPVVLCGPTVRTAGRSVGRAPHAGTSGRRPEVPEAPRSRPAAPATATPWVPAARMKKHPKPAPLGAGSGRTKPFRFMRKCARGAPLGYRPAVIPANLPQSASPHGKRSEKPKV